MRLFNKLKGNKVINAGGWYTLTNFLTKGIAFITIPIFTRLLTTTDYGIISLYNSWLGIFTVFIGLSLHESIRRAKYDYEADYDQFVSSITFLSIIIFVFYLIIFYIFRNTITNIVGLSTSIIAFMIIQSFFTYIHNFAMTKFRLEYKYKSSSIISIILSMSGVILSILLITHYYTNNKALGKIIGTGIFYILIGIFFALSLLKKGKKIINFEYWKYGLVLGFPLIFHGLGLIANSQFDRIIINKYLGASVTGIYSFAYQMGMIIQILFTSIDQAWNPWFYEKYKDMKFTSIREKANMMRNVFTVLYGTVLFLSPEIVRLMANEQYWDGLRIIPWIFMANYFVFMYALEVNVEYANKKTHLIAVGTFISAISNIILNIIFIPIYGYIAAAITTVISYFLLFLFHYIVTSKILKIKLYGLRFHIISIIYVVSITLIYQLLLPYFWMRISLILILWISAYKALNKIIPFS